MDYDLKIINGLVIDGTGAPGQVGDVAIKDGHVVAIGNAPGTAAQEIDARDRVVCPGFVDIHTHYDAQVLWDRLLSISPWHGVTTVVMGNCGFGIAPARKEHRKLLIQQTLEKVEGMSAAALEERTRHRVGFRDLSAIPRPGRKARHRDQRGGAPGPCYPAAPPVRDGRKRDRACRDRRGDCRDASHRQGRNP